MKIETANRAVLAVKLAFAAFWGYLTLASIPGALIAVLLAYSLIQSYPRPFKTFKESLRVNWRGWCLFSGIIGMAILGFAFHMPEAKLVCSAFSAAFVGVIFGELIGKVIYGLVKQA